MTVTPLKAENILHTRMVRAGGVGTLLACALCLAVCFAPAFGRPNPLETGLVTYRKLLATCESPSFPALKPSTIDSKAVGVQWVGVDDQYVFVITINNRVWRSKDGGSSFEDITERFRSSIKGEEPVALVQIIPHKTKPNNILFVGAGVNTWTSKDYGETLVPHKNPAGWMGYHSTMRPHPTEPDWILALVRRPGCGLLDQVQLRCVSDLVLTQDAYGEQAWANLTANAKGQIAGFVDWDWAKTGCLKSGKCAGMGLQDTSIMATMYAKAGDWDMAWDPDVQFVRSDDFFKTIKHKVPCGNQFELMGSQVYLAVANNCPTTIDGKPAKVEPTTGITLYRSNDGGTNFVQTCLPVAVKQEGFELMETHDGEGAVVIVDYLTRTTAGYRRGSSAFTAGPHHALFSLSLTNIFRAETLSSASDFMRVDGMMGVFIANQVSARRSGSSAPAGSLDRGLVETRITFNGGGVWQPIKAPSHINHPKCDRCGGSSNCSLHLHGASSWFFGSAQYPTVYSHMSSPGLLMASGNVGTDGVGLDDNDGVCTWLSFDGGFSWSDIAEGTWIYEYADWGGMVVMTKHAVNGPAAEVRFSLDYGRCWKSVPLETALSVDNIRIEADGQRPKVLIHGKACRKSDHPKCTYDTGDSRSILQGLLYALDIAQLMGDKLPGCKPTDYEQWTIPAEDHTPRCLLGEQRQFTRRRQDATCLNGASWLRPAPLNKTCQCTTADVECDFGWQRDGDTCRKLPQDKMPHCPVLESGTYTVSASGKRLVHADTCTGIDKIISDTDGKGGGCSHGQRPGGKAGSKGSGGVLSWLLMLLLIPGVAVGAAMLWYKFLASDQAKVQAEDAVASAVSWVYSLGVLVVFKAQELLGRGSQRLSGTGAAAAGAYAPLDEELNYFQPIADGGEEFPLSRAGLSDNSGVYSIK